MKTPSARARKIAAFGAAPVAVLAAGAMVWQASNAAFTATTQNSGNSWSTGSVYLTDDDNGVAAFTADNIVPGQTGERCIVVTSNSNVPGAVRPYTEHLVPSRGLEDRIHIDLVMGTGGSFNDCAGFQETANEIPEMTLAELAAANTDFESGGAAWETAGNPGENRTYKATWRFDTTGMTQEQINALQGSQVSIDLIWELQSDDTPTQP
ncbi:hypothetical protein AAIH25_02885 [Arthrobacter crystallopoietes]|uniref:hypothetical protein n=1 Tax=Crystallibacter crystallopoietes TaxID=37928 RepID=UPI003D21AE4E